VQGEAEQWKVVTVESVPFPVVGQQIEPAVQRLRQFHRASPLWVFGDDW